MNIFLVPIDQKADSFFYTSRCQGKLFFFYWSHGRNDEEEDDDAEQDDKKKNFWNPCLSTQTSRPCRKQTDPSNSNCKTKKSSTCSEKKIARTRFRNSPQASHSPRERQSTGTKTATAFDYALTTWLQCTEEESNGYPTWLYGWKTYDDAIVTSWSRDRSMKRSTEHSDTEEETPTSSRFLTRSSLPRDKSLDAKRVMNIFLVPRRLLPTWKTFTTPAYSRKTAASLKRRLISRTRRAIVKYCNLHQSNSNWKKKKNSSACSGEDCCRPSKLDSPLVQRTPKDEVEDGSEEEGKRINCTIHSFCVSRQPYKRICCPIQLVFP